MREGLSWKAGRYTMHDEAGRPIAEVARVAGGWAWYLIGQNVGGDVVSCSDAMSAVEKALNVDAAAVRTVGQ